MSSNRPETVPKTIQISKAYKMPIENGQDGGARIGKPWNWLGTMKEGHIGELWFTYNSQDTGASEQGHEQLVTEMNTFSKTEKMV